ncbi:MAG: anti-sigma factor [Actinobacteria bacterium]|nr:anti-sigma factor [Actinomycetota bacterium]
MSERCTHAETVAAYLLGALTDAERREFEMHLTACVPCREDLAGLRVVADALPLAVPPVAPSAALRDRLLETVRAEAEVLSAAGPTADRPPAQRRGRRRFVRPLGRPLGLTAAALALLLGVALGFGVGAATNERTETQTVVQVRTVQARVDATAAPRGTAVIVVRDGVATLRVRGLPAPPPGKVYEVWLLRRGAAAPSPTDALFSVSTRGSGRVALPSVRGVEAVLVTAEPDGGSRAPTSQPFINAAL